MPSAAQPPRDELLFLGPLYGGTEGLLRSMGERWGLRVTDATTVGLAAAWSSATRMVWAESLTAKFWMKVFNDLKTRGCNDT